MPTDWNRLGHLILAALLTASLTSLAQAEAPALKPVDPKVTSGLRVKKKQERKYLMKRLAI